MQIISVLIECKLAKILLDGKIIDFSIHLVWESLLSSDSIHQAMISLPEFPQLRCGKDYSNA